MRMNNFVFVAAVAVLASVNGVYAVTNMGNVQVSKMASDDSVSSIKAIPADAKRFLRCGNTVKPHDVEDEERVDEHVIQEVAAQIHGLLPYVLKVHKKPIEEAIFFLRYQKVEWGQVERIVNYLKLR